MPNDEHPAPVNQESCQFDAPGTCQERCVRAHDERLQPYRPSRRHRDDRRVTTPPGRGWEPLGPIAPDSLGWPEARLS